MTRLISAWRALTPEQRLAAGASGALFVTMFLPWYQQNAVVNAPRTAPLQSRNLNAFQVFSFVEAAVLLVAVAVLYLLFARGERRSFQLPGGDGGVVLAAGLWAALLLVLRLFDKPGITSHGVAANVGIQWGIFFALAEDRLFFEPLARVHPRFKTPHVAVILSGALGILYVLAATALSGSKAFGSLTDAFVIGIVPFYALSVGSVFVFRRREKKRQAANPEPLEDSLIDPVERGHLETHPHTYTPSVHTPLYPLTPLLFVASTLFLLVNSLLDAESRIPTLITLGILVIGAPIYFGTIGRRRKNTS